MSSASSADRANLSRVGNAGDDIGGFDEPAQGSFAEGSDGVAVCRVVDGIVEFGGVLGQVVEFVVFVESVDVFGVGGTAHDGLAVPRVVVEDLQGAAWPVEAFRVECRRTFGFGGLHFAFAAAAFAEDGVAQGRGGVGQAGQE